MATMVDQAAPTIYIKDIIIGCTDIETVASFWSRVLSRPIATRIGPFVWLERRDGVGLGFQALKTSTGRSNSIHLDLGSHDPVAEQARIEAMGGERVAGFEDGGFLVMADPEGNRFCVIPAGSFEVDDQGRTDYANPG